MTEVSVEALATFFAGTVQGSGPEPTSLPSKSQRPDPPVISNSTANLDGFEPLLPLYPPDWCYPDFAIIECRCGRRVVPSACMSLDCEHCAGQIQKRRAGKIIRRLLGTTLYQRKRHHTTIVLYTIFTIPPHLREKYLDRKLWTKLRKKAWGLLKKYYAAAYGVEASHPKGDRNEDMFAPHMNFLWRQHKGYRPFIDVDLLRAQWAKILKTEVVDVYHQYSSKFPQIIHWAKYVARTFPGTHKWTGPMRWYGKYPKARPVDKCTCLDCNSSFKFIGFVTARLVDEYWERGFLMGRAPPWERDADITPVRSPSY